MRKYLQKNREFYNNCGEIKCKYPATEKYGLWKNMPEKILSYSGGIQKEAYVLSVPCITLRENTEWVETLEGGWNVLVGADKSKIKKALYSSLPACRKRNGFESEGASERILNTLRCLMN